MDRQRTLSPIDGSVVVERDYATPMDVVATLGRARLAQRAWRFAPIDERAAICSRMVDAFVAEKDAIATLVKKDTWEKIDPALQPKPGQDKDHAERYKNDQLHKPVAQGQCLVCHEPHASNNHGMLRKPAAALCLDCHPNVTKTTEGGSTHAPASIPELAEAVVASAASGDTIVLMSNGPFGGVYDQVLTGLAERSFRR